MRSPVPSGIPPPLVERNPELVDLALFSWRFYDSDVAVIRDQVIDEGPVLFAGLELTATGLAFAICYIRDGVNVQAPLYSRYHCPVNETRPFWEATPALLQHGLFLDVDINVQSVKLRWRSLRP